MRRLIRVAGGWLGALAIGGTLVAAGRQAPGAVTHLPAARVAAAFVKGEPLLETTAYKIHASRREAAGLGEVHEHDTDILYVLEGAATLVTGGRLVAPTPIGPGEVRGRAIEGGRRERLSKGDVWVVPSGVPHWFEEVDAPLLYYVVKVSDTTGRTR